MKKIREYGYIIVFLGIVLGFGILSYRPGKDLDSSFAGKTSFININGAISRILGQPMINDVVKLDNGYLLTTMDYMDNKLLQKYADSTAKLRTYLENRGTKLLFAVTPYTLSKYDPQLPEGVEDYGNDNMDRFLKMLQEAGIDTIDFREEMYEDGIDQYDMMYRTDHHWTTEAGLYAYGILKDYIVEKTGCKVDERISNIQNYTITTYEKWHLGSRGQRTGIYYAGIDDFDLIIPDFETSLQNVNGDVGTMQELMINMEPLESKDYFSRNTYDSVMRGSLGYFTNLNCENDVRILMINDSMGNVVNPYLAMSFRQIDYVRNTEAVQYVTPEYIENYDPDIGISISIFLPDMKIAIEFSTLRDNRTKEIVKNTICRRKGFIMVRILEPGVNKYDNCYCIPWKEKTQESLQHVLRMASYILSIKY